MSASYRQARAPRAGPGPSPVTRSTVPANTGHRVAMTTAVTADVAPTLRHLTSPPGIAQHRLAEWIQDVLTRPAEGMASNSGTRTGNCTVPLGRRGTVGRGAGQALDTAPSSPKAHFGCDMNNGVGQGDEEAQDTGTPCKIMENGGATRATEMGGSHPSSVFDRKKLVDAMNHRSK